MNANNEVISAELAEIAASLERQDESAESGQNWRSFQIEPAMRRGRPRKKVRWVISVRQPSEQRRHIAEETARWIAEDVAQMRAERLEDARAARAAQRLNSNGATRLSLRVKSIANSLETHPAWACFSNRWVAGRLAVSYPHVKPDTLRKDVAAARKLARVTSK